MNAEPGFLDKEDYSFSKGLWIYGAFGSGKTLLMLAYRKAKAILENKVVGLKTCVEMNEAFLKYDIDTNEPNRLIGAAVGCAVPARPKKYGYLSEHHCFGETEGKAGDYAEDLAASMLASTLGIKFNLDDAWDTRRQAFRLSGKIVYTSNVTQTARANKDGLWTSVVTAAIFVP